MTEKYLYEELSNEFVKEEIKKIQLPHYLIENLNTKFDIRPYQKEAFQRFLFYDKKDFSSKQFPIHLLFNMATGSGKTLMMAGLILYLYEKGYRKFLFFVDSTNIVEKTKDNFLNKNSNKYLFNKQIIFNGKEVAINEVSNFNESKDEDINIFFTTIQGLHQNLNLLIKENCITYEDFQEKEIVLLSDEAHHINVATKKNDAGKKNWEETVQKIFNLSKENILLEFTATIDLSIPEIKEKYKNKILYKYDLLNFRKDGFSKEIKTLSLDSELDQVMLHAILLSQYRLKIAEKNKIALKPIILFKAQKTIAQSKVNEENFKKLIEELDTAKLKKILDINFLAKKNTILVKAFSYLDSIYKGNYQNLIEELQQEFSNEKILNVNEDKDKKNNQLLLNTLEDQNNPIRAIFAVNKLNEGWDVLNLFDIVRVYDTRDGQWQRNGKYKVGKTTLSEAQLIGRGARYYPFKINDEQEFFKRKYDEDIENELKILEELHYHSKYNSRYLQELEEALIEQGLQDKKDSIKKEKIEVTPENKEFYQKKIVFKNKQIVNDNQDKKSFKDYKIQDVFKFKTATAEIKEKKVFEEGKTTTKQNEIYRHNLKSIEKIIFLKAFNQNKEFWTFGNLKRYFGNLKSIDNLLDEKFFYSLEVESNKEELDNQDKLNLINYLLRQISPIIKRNATHKKGSEIFKSYPFQKVFKEAKELRFEQGNSNFKEIDIKNIRKYFLHDKLFGTSEEENFITFFSAYLQKLLEKYQEVKLVRNNRELKIYRFDDGEGFEPDFLLFLTQKNGEEIFYQVFIEPKGKHLLKEDQEKEDFLKQIKEKYQIEELTKESYRLLGLRFYNRDKENEFKEDFKEELLNTKIRE